MRAPALVVILALLLAAAAPAAADHQSSKAYKEGQVYCTAGALVMGPMVIQGGRCYLLGVYRDPRGTFLAFINPATLATPGRLIRLDSSAGHRIRAQILYLVPLQGAGAGGTVIPMNTIRLIAVREEHRHEGGKEDTVLVVAGLSAPTLSVTFVVRF